jgi:hypothetical protein
MSTLAETQRLLWRLIAAPEGVAATLAADADRGGELAAALVNTVRGERALDAVQRLDIYANMYFFRVLDVLKEDHPATLALLGEVGFHNLVTDYLLAHPPAHFSIREVGRHLPEFLAQHALAARHPCAGELSHYERALNDAFDAADAPALSTPDLADVAPDEWPGLHFALHPSVRLLACRWPVALLRSALERGEPVADPSAQASRLCVWREALVVYHRELEEFEFAALRAVERGARFDGVCDAASEWAGEGNAAQRVVQALAGWLQHGWLAAGAL